MSSLDSASAVEDDSLELVPFGDQLEGAPARPSLRELNDEMQSDPNYALHRDFGFLVQDIARILRARIDSRARRVNLTQAQWRIAAYLVRQPGLTQTGLAAILDMRKTALSPMIERMLESRWIERRADPQDRRILRLFLTDEIASTFQQVRRESREMYESVLADLTESEEKILVDLLTRVKTRLMDGAG